MRNAKDNDFVGRRSAAADAKLLFFEPIMPQKKLRDQHASPGRKRVRR